MCCSHGGQRRCGCRTLCRDSEIGSLSKERGREGEKKERDYIVLLLLLLLFSMAFITSIDVNGVSSVLCF